MGDGPIPIRRENEVADEASPDSLASTVFLWGLVVLTLALLGAGVVWVWQAVL